MQLKKYQQSIVYEQTIKQFELQLKIIQKIVQSQLWAGKRQFPSILIYQISMYVFNNPIRLKFLAYSHCIDRSLRVNQKYLLKAKQKEPSINISSPQSTEVGAQKCNERSAFITISKQWRALNTKELSYAEIIQKGRLFLNFLSNVKIKVHPDDPINYDPLNDFEAYKKQEKQRSKYYTLISDHYSIFLRQFDDIFQYEKNKKINDVLIKAFVSLMNNNIAIVKIEENYNSNLIGFEGKYVYIANRHQLPFMKSQQKKITKDELKQVKFDIPWLQINKDDQWKLCCERHHKISIYKQQTYPLKRGKSWLINKKLQYFLQNDVWISHQ